MAYKQVKKYGYRDSLEKGDPEKVIYGVDFDAEFEAIEQAFDGVPGAGGDPIAPETPGFEDVVFQTRTEDQQVVSKFTFAVDGQPPLTVENTGIWNDVNYVRYDTVDATWKVSPGLEVDGDFTVNGETSLNGNLNVDGDIDATGNLNVDQNVTIGGYIDGDLTVNGNITIDGGTIIDGGGSQMGYWLPEGDTFIRHTFGGDGLTAGGIEIEAPTGSVWYMEGFGAFLRLGRRGGSNYLRIDGDADMWCGSIDANGQIAGTKFIMDGGTASQLLCADGSVVDKGSVGSDTDLSAYYTKTQVDGFAVKLTGNQTIGGIKTFSSDIRCKANVYAYYGSDERLKDDITPMPVGLIDAIEPATWKWKEDGRSSAGVIAQQLQQAGLGDWVRESPDGDLGVDYNALIGMLIAEVQDLKRRLADG